MTRNPSTNDAFMFRLCSKSQVFDQRKLSVDKAILTKSVRKKYMIIAKADTTYVPVNRKDNTTKVEIWSVLTILLTIPRCYSLIDHPSVLDEINYASKSFTSQNCAGRALCHICRSTDGYAYFPLRAGASFTPYPSSPRHVAQLVGF